MAMPEEEVRKELAATANGSEPPKDGNIFLYLLQRMDSMESNLRSEIRATHERIDDTNKRMDAMKSSLHNEIKQVESSLRSEIRATHERIDSTNNRIDSLGADLRNDIKSLNGRLNSVITINLTAIGVAVAFLSWLLLIK